MKKLQKRGRQPGDRGDARRHFGGSPTPCRGSASFTSTLLFLFYKVDSNFVFLVTASLDASVFTARPWQWFWKGWGVVYGVMGKLSVILGWKYLESLFTFSSIGWASTYFSIKCSCMLRFKIKWNGFHPRGTKKMMMMLRGKLPNAHTQFTPLFSGSRKWHHKLLISTPWFPWRPHVYQGEEIYGKLTCWQIYTASIFKAIGLLLHYLLLSWDLTETQKFHLTLFHSVHEEIMLGGVLV